MQTVTLNAIEEAIIAVPDFPKPGILFYDISRILSNSDLWKTTIHTMVNKISPLKPDLLIGIESRGFLFAGAMAFHMQIGCAMIRKKGKLPKGNLITSSPYQLEYGSSILEINAETVQHFNRIVLIDDVLATGGTVLSSIGLLNECQKFPVGIISFIELTHLKAREKLAIPTFNIIEKQ